MGGKVGRQIARPFKYTLKAGSSQTSQTGRHNIGGVITGVSTKIILSDKTTINPSNFKAYLQSKLNSFKAVQHFAVLQYVKVGSRQYSQFKLNVTNASLQQIGVAVKKNAHNSMEVSIIWKKSVANFTTPQIRIDKVTRHYNIGMRNSDNSSDYISRGLTDKEQNAINQALQIQVKKQNVALQAENKL